MTQDLVNALECIIFLADEPLAEGRLAGILEVEEAQIGQLAEQLSERLDGSGLQVLRIAGGYKLSTRPAYAAWVERLREPEPSRLSQAALETLAVIAYRQPVTQPEIEAVRGVDCSGVVTTLLEKGLVAVAGRRKAPGRPFLYRTTTQFLATFGLADLSELPLLDSLLRASEVAFGVPAAEEPDLPLQPADDDADGQPVEPQAPQPTPQEALAEE